MLKVVIADDEARVCSLIQVLIDWDALGLELAGTAANGFEALELIEREHADILITDIRMPGCSGLELIEKAKAVSPRLEIVIISGYAHFEYAQQAIRFGVSDYLLKPISQQQINDTLSKLAERCRDSRTADSEILELRKSSQENTRQLQARLIQDLLSGSFTSADPAVLRKEYCFAADTECLLPVLLQIDYDESAVSAEALRIVEEKALSTFERELEGTCPTLAASSAGGQGGLLLGYAEKDRDAVRNQLRKCLHQLCAYIEMYDSLDFSMAIGPVITDVSKIRDAFAAARAIACERLICGTGRILDVPPPPSVWKPAESLNPFRQALNELPKPGSDALLIRELDRLEQEVCGRTDLRGGDVYELVLSAARMLLQQPGIADRAEKLQRFTRCVLHTGRMKKLFEMLKALTREEAGALIEEQRSANTRPIRQAQDYVRKHYREPITLEKICDEVGFSVSYFSALYKKETGENFQHFVTRVRVDRARELLTQTALPVSEICDLVGYSDIKYFTQTFKKETELSPAQYRKLYG